MSDREKAQEICTITHHVWNDADYGIECINCGLFYPYGYEPWMSDDDVDDGEPDFTLDDLEWDETYPELTEGCWYCGLIGEPCNCDARLSASNTSAE